MFLNLFLILVLSVLNLTASFPSLRQSPPQQYYLRTSIVDATNDSGTCKDNLYIIPYHTGAGHNVVVLTSDISNAVSGNLNSSTNSNNGQTNWITNFTTIVAGNTTLYWDLCAAETAYANWGAMTINLGDYTYGTFYADGDLLAFGLGNWLACDWWYGVPQLFFITLGGDAGEPLVTPSSCSLVDLQMINVDDAEDR